MREVTANVVEVADNLCEVAPNVSNLTDTVSEVVPTSAEVKQGVWHVKNAVFDVRAVLFEVTGTLFDLAAVVSDVIAIVVDAAHTLSNAIAIVFDATGLVPGPVDVDFDVGFGKVDLRDCLMDATKQESNFVLNTIDIRNETKDNKKRDTLLDIPFFNVLIALCLLVSTAFDFHIKTQDFCISDKYRGNFWDLQINRLESLIYRRKWVCL